MANKDKLQELVARIVARIETRAQVVERVVWTSTAQPFFALAAGAEGQAAPLWRPRTDSNRRRRP